MSSFCIVTMVGFSLLLIAVATKRWMFVSNLKRSGRWLHWSVVTDRLRSEQGYLILNYGNTSGYCWWVESIPDDKSIEELLWEDAFLTNCPILMQSFSCLSKSFPGRVRTAHEISFS